MWRSFDHQVAPVFRAAEDDRSPPTPLIVPYWPVDRARCYPPRHGKGSDRNGVRLCLYGSRVFESIFGGTPFYEGPSSIWKPASWGAPPCPPEDTRLAELICTAVRRTRAQSTFSVFTGFPYPNVRVARERENPGTRLQRGPSVVSNWSSFQRYAQRWSDVQSGTIGSTRAHDQGTENKQKKSRANQGQSPHNTDTRCKTQAQQERTANEIYTSPRAHQASSRATSI